MSKFRRGERCARRGNYSLLFSVMLVMLLGFAALAIDVSYVRLGQSQAQDVADAASQAAVVMLRRTGDEDLATTVANQVVDQNWVVGLDPNLATLELGTWDDDVFVAGGQPTNAARAIVDRNLDLMLAPLFGWNDALVNGEAIAAARALHVVLVIDITNSWNQDDFAGAREAAVAFFDTLADAHGPDDRIGMVVFTGRYGVEHSPLQLVEDAVDNGTRDLYASLGTASKAGWPSGNRKGCNTHGNNDFSTPYNGCFPQMWREYTDEPGTDHSVGIEMALQMFSEQTDPAVYRAMIILTDGNPNGTGPHRIRSDEGYEETRWRYITTTYRGTSDVIYDTQAMAATAFDDWEVNTWAVSFVSDASWMESVAQGDGYYVRESDPGALAPIFEDIAESLPLALVR